MRLLLGDETNSNPNTSDFFIYGGVHFDMVDVAPLDSSIRELRHKYGYEPGDDLKWNGKPEAVTPEQHAYLKGDLLDLLFDYDAEFIPVMVHYNLIAEEEGPIQWRTCMRDLLGQFKFSLDENEAGIAALDHIPEGGAEAEKDMLEEVFSHGLDHGVDLDEIKLMSVTYSNASHLSSLTDVVLGAFQFCVNNPDHPKASEIFLKVAAVTKGWKGDTFDYKYGIVLRPIDPGEYGGRRRDYDAPYEELKETLDELLEEEI